MKPSNEAIIAALRQLVAYTQLEDGQSQSFRTRAYEKAIDALRSVSGDIADMSVADLKKVDGVGESTAKKIVEFTRDGSIEKLDRLKATYPPSMLELMKIPGLGPKTVLALREHIDVVDVAGLRVAIAAERLRDLPGLGKKSEEKIAQAIELLGIHSDETRTPIFDAMQVARRVIADLEQLESVDSIEYAGSLRRLSETIGDIDILVTSSTPQTVIDAFTSLPGVTTVLGSGTTKASVVVDDTIQVDLRVVEAEAFGAALLYFTGSKTHNIELRQRAMDRGWTLNEYALTEVDGGAVVAAASEEDIYEALDMAWIPPEMREGAGEVAAAGDRELPERFDSSMLRGDLHFHSDWSGDGRSSLEDMLSAAADRGLEYVAVTDHAEDLAMNGLSRDRMLAQRAAIEQLRERFPGLTILHGAELNIDPDGGVDYDAAFLDGFDFGVASIHSHFELDATVQTDRLLTAIENPAVNVVGHPSGRRIGMRPGVRFDLETVGRAAADTGTALEINCHLQRLDLSAPALRTLMAIEGLQFAISTDAHHVSELANVRWGVAQARKGWVTPDRVVNVLPIGEFNAWKDRKRKG